MQGVIGFEHLEVLCCIGIEEAERTNPQKIYIDLKIERDLSASIHSDRLKDTTSYVYLAEVCNEIAVRKKTHLLEALAGEILDQLLQDSAICRAWIRIKKPQALPNAAYALVELEKERACLGR